MSAAARLSAIKPPIGDVATMSTTANKQLVQKIYAESASRSGTTFADNLADDAVWIVTGQYSWSHEFRGREAIQNGLMGHFRSFFAVRPRTVAFNFIAEESNAVGQFFLVSREYFQGIAPDPEGARAQFHIVALILAFDQLP